MLKGPIAQLVELPAHNRLVPGSSPGGPTIKAQVKAEATVKKLKETFSVLTSTFTFTCFILLSWG